MEKIQNSERQLMTVKKISQLTGTSRSFLRQLMREGKLTKYQINSAVFVDFAEFERVAQPVTA